MSMPLSEFEELNTPEKIETSDYICDFYKKVLLDMGKNHNVKLTPYNIVITGKHCLTKHAHITYYKKEIVIYDLLNHWRGSIIHEATHQLFYTKRGKSNHDVEFWITLIYYCKRFNVTDCAYIPKPYKIFYDILYSIPETEALNLDEIKAKLPNYDHNLIVKYLNCRAMRDYINVKFDNSTMPATPYFIRNSYKP